MRGVSADTGREGVGAPGKDALRLSQEKGPESFGLRGWSASERGGGRDVPGERGTKCRGSTQKTMHGASTVLPA